MVSSRVQQRPRTVFAERFALLYATAGNPPLKRVAESVARMGRIDEKGRPIRVTVQRVSDWRRGQNVPARFDVLAQVLEVLIVQARKSRPEPAVDGLYRIAAWHALWKEALTSPVSSASAEKTGNSFSEIRTGREIPEDTGTCPYRGLAAYTQEDSEWFFGRERATTALLERLEQILFTGGIVPLVGASGVGKSSLLSAGLIPALKRSALSASSSADWPITTMTPGTDPLNELRSRVPELYELITGIRDSTAAQPVKDEAAMAPTTFEVSRAALTEAVVPEKSAIYGSTGPDARLVLIVDQFEEIFTLCEDKGKARAFVQFLHAISTPRSSAEPAPAIVVLGLRADFYGRCLGHPELAEALQDRQIVLGPMAAEEVQEAVFCPAKMAGLQLEGGLFELILRDIGANHQQPTSETNKTGGDRGALPLLSHALLATWQHRQTTRLTISGYLAAGGIQKAIVVTAEESWSQLEPTAQAAARHILLALVNIGECPYDTRRRTTRGELLERSPNRDAAEQALEKFAQARLITLDADSVEISHEALLDAWPRLRNWIDEDRGCAVIRQRLETDSAIWDAEARHASLLYRGARLEAVREWEKKPGITKVAREFLVASARHRHRMLWARHAAVLLVVVLALVATITSVLATLQRDEAVFRQVLAEAERVQSTDPSMSAQLNLVANQMRPDDPEVYSRLIATQAAPLATALYGHDSAIYLTSYSPDGATLATASYDNTIRLWNMRDPSHSVQLGEPLTGHTSWVTSAVFSPDGKILASAGNDETVRLWNVADPARPTLLGQPFSGQDGTIYLVAFNSDGKILATANENGTVRLWNVSDPSHPVLLAQPFIGSNTAVRSVAFSPDGRTLAAGGDDKTIRLWDVADPTRPTPLGPPLTGHTDIVHSVAFSPDGRTLATGGDDKTVRLWDVTDPSASLPLGSALTGGSRAVWSVTFSSDGQLLAAGSADGTARLWNVGNRARPTPLGPPLPCGSTVFAVAFSPDGRALVTGTEEGVARVWSLPDTSTIGGESDIRLLTFGPNGHLLATANGDSTIRVWNVADPTRPQPFTQPTTRRNASIWSLAISPDGRMIASGYSDRTIQLWDIKNSIRPVPLGNPIPSARYASVVAFRPDSRILATASSDQEISLWRLDDPSSPAPTPLGAPLTGHSGYVNSAEFSPDGRVLATASSDTTVRLWDVSDPSSPTPLGPPLTGHTKPVRLAKFSPAGGILATASEDGTVRLWDVTEASRPKFVGIPLAGLRETVNTLAFRPDGNVLIAGSGRGTVRLWDVTDPANPKILGQSVAGTTDTEWSLAYSPDGNYLTSATMYGNVQRWDLNKQAAIHRICAVTRGALTHEQWARHVVQLPYEPPCE